MGELQGGRMLHVFQPLSVKTEKLTENSEESNKFGPVFMHVFLGMFSIVMKRIE